jgi:hypothetical protein
MIFVVIAGFFIPCSSQAPLCVPRTQTISRLWFPKATTASKSKSLRITPANQALFNNMQAPSRPTEESAFAKHLVCPKSEQTVSNPYAQDFPSLQNNCGIQFVKMAITSSGCRFL